MRRAILLCSIFLMVVLNVTGQGKQVLTGAGSGGCYYVGTLPKDDASAFQKLKIEVMGGSWYSSTVGITTYYIGVRDGNVVNQEVHGGGCSHFELVVYKIGDAYDFVIKISQEWASIFIRAWMIKDGGMTNLVEQNITPYDPNGKNDVTTQFPIKTIFATNTNGNIGIGTNTLTHKFNVSASNGDGIRIGKIGDTGNLSVPMGAQTAQYNIDFTGYRDTETEQNQIGARISALRFSNIGGTTALVQKTGLSFSTNPSGWGAGTSDLKERMRITPEGLVGIGVTLPQHSLDVKGTICADEVLVKTIDWSDFVFDKNYKLRDLKEVDQYIQENGHLPEIPSATEVKEKGVNVVEVQAKLLQKVEEMTLYIIAQEKRIQELQEHLTVIERDNSKKMNNE